MFYTTHSLHSLVALQTQLWHVKKQVIIGLSPSLSLAFTVYTKSWYLSELDRLISLRIISCLSWIWRRMATYSGKDQEKKHIGNHNWSVSQPCSREPQLWKPPTTWQRDSSACPHPNYSLFTAWWTTRHLAPPTFFILLAQLAWEPIVCRGYDGLFVWAADF